MNTKRFKQNLNLVIKKIVFRFTLINTSIILLFLTNSCDNNIQNISQEYIVLNISGLTITNKEFNKHLNKQSYNDSLKKSEIVLDLLESNIVAGLLWEVVKQQHYDRKPQIKNKLDEIENNTLIEVLKTYELENQGITKKEIEKCYKRAKERREINHVIVKMDNDQLIEEIVEYLDDGGEDFTKFGTKVFFKKEIITGGSLTKDLEEAVYALKIGEIDVITTKQKKHIIQLASIRPNKIGSFEQEKEKLKFRLAKTKLKTNGGSFIEKEKSKHKIFINPKIMSPYCNLSILPLPDSIQKANVLKYDNEKVVALVQDREITNRELLDKIKKQREENNFIFKSKKHRYKAILTLLCLDSGLLPSKNKKIEQITSYKETLMIEKLLKNEVEIFNANSKQKFFTEKILDKYQDVIINDCSTSIYEALIREAYIQNIDQDQFILEKLKEYQHDLSDEANMESMDNLDASHLIKKYRMENVSFLDNEEKYLWLFPELAFRNHVDDVKIDHNEIYTLDLPQNKISNNDILAIKENVKLTVKDYNKKWKKLPAKIQDEILNSRLYSTDKYYSLQRDFIESIFNPINNFIQNKNGASINYHLLNQINLPIKENSDYTLPQDNETVVSFGKISFTLKQLRQKISLMTIQNRNQFNNLDTRKKAIENLLINEIQLKEVYNRGLNTQAVVLEKIKRKKRWFLSQLFYEKFNGRISCLENEDLHQILQNHHLKSQRKRILKLVNNYKDSIDITIDTGYFKELDILVTKSILEEIVVKKNLFSYILVLSDKESPLQRHYWLNIPGELRFLKYNIEFPYLPSHTDYIYDLEFPSNINERYGSTTYGYLHVPISGHYKFWISGDDQCELWLSENFSKETKQIIARVPDWTYPREWYKYNSQQSEEIYLTGGQLYYIEAIHKEINFGDNLAVAWQIPGEQPQIILGKYLIPAFNNYFY